MRTRLPVRRCPKAVALVYMTIVVPVMFGMAVLAVDVGRVAMARAELQDAADAAARYAAVGMIASSQKATTAYNQAVSACSALKVDGGPVVVTSGSVEVGIWNSQNRTFTVSSSNAQINAVRITLTHTLGGSGSLPTFAQAMGGPAKVIRCQSIAIANAHETEVISPSQGNLWLAGMPDNTTITNLQGNSKRYDNSGTTANRKQRPEEVSLTSLGLEAGDLVCFEGLSGSGSNGAGASTTGPDGNTSWKVALGNSNPGTVPQNSANGIANVRAPIAAVMAVFLDQYAPNTSSAPPSLDFGSQSQRDYHLLSPQLKQPFFVGDGKTSTGEVQYIRVPAGATRIFLGMMDAWQWNDNTGSFRMKFYRGQTVVTVK